MQNAKCKSATVMKINQTFTFNILHFKFFISILSAQTSPG
jgi:hypothetical protein